MQKTIFVVDDVDTNLSSAKEALKEHYRVMTLPSAAKMFALLDKITPDLILLDIEMPEMDGFEALSRLKTINAYIDIPVIFLTGMTDPSVEVRGFELGVVDFVTKPFSSPVLLNRIKTHLSIDTIIRERTVKLQRLQNTVIYGFADLVESRDQNTGGHIERTTKYIKKLLDAMLERGIYIDEICDLDFDAYISSARLHDVGKISISDNILNKPDKLNDEEFAIMKTHAAEGERVIDKFISYSGNDEIFLKNAKLFAGYHHERWDGKGYPHGLKEKNIPLQGRIMAFVDVYDALVSERPYKKPFSHEDAIKLIIDNAGTQFDPVISEIIKDIQDQFKLVKMSLP